MRDLVHENLGRLLPAIFRDFRKTPTKTRIGRCAFSVRSFPRLLVASRRHGRRRALLAALPAAPAAPLSQKSRFAAIFGSPVYFSGTLIIKRAPPSPFLQNKSAHRADARFSVCQKFIPRTEKRRSLCGGNCRKCFPAARAGPRPVRWWSGCICIRRGQSTRWCPRLLPAHKT